MPEEDSFKGITPIVSIDCEMIICEDKQKHLARLTIVNYNRHIIFDEYIKPKLKVINYLTHITNLDAFKVQRASTYDTYQQ